HGGGETPGLIPNPEAKPSSADGTAPERVWESRTPPDKHRMLRAAPTRGRPSSVSITHAIAHAQWRFCIAFRIVLSSSADWSTGRFGNMAMPGLPWPAQPHTDIAPPSVLVEPHLMTPPRGPAASSCTPSTPLAASAIRSNVLLSDCSGDTSTPVPPTNRTERDSPASSAYTAPVVFLRSTPALTAVRRYSIASWAPGLSSRARPATRGGVTML